MNTILNRIAEWWRKLNECECIGCHNPASMFGMCDQCLAEDWKRADREVAAESLIADGVDFRLAPKPFDASKFRASIAGIHAMADKEHLDMLGYRSAMLAIRGECEHLIPELEKLRR